MSSSEAESAEISSSSPFQSAQQQAEYNTDGEDLSLEVDSEYLSDVLSSHGSGLQSSQRESSSVDDSVAKHIGAGDELVDKSQDSTIPPSRPNKFFGPSSTWRNWTAPEIDLAASLDRLQAKGLSVHLYNFFKLKQRYRHRDQAWRTHASKASGKRQESNWIPPKVWTAWPLPPDIVPREHDEVHWEGDADPSVQHYSSSRRPGQHLQEMLVAQVLRIAKERFHQRQWEGAMQSEPHAPAQGQQSQPIGKDPNEKSNAFHELNTSGQKPMVMADDQRASDILQATVRHMMTKLDNLLRGLHHARSSYVLVEDSGSDSHDHANKRPKSRGRPRKRKRERSKPEESVEAEDDAPDYPSSGSEDYNPSRKKSGSQRSIQHNKFSSRRSHGQKFHDRKRRLGLRDWSDVLGIASMIGWHQNVVRSATARCTTLLEEGIKFRTLEEGKKVHEEQVYLPNVPLASSEDSQSDIRGSLSDRYESTMHGGVHVDGFLEPIEGKKSWTYSNSKQSKQRRSSRISRG